MAIPDTILADLPPQTYDALRPDLRTGDLLLWNGRSRFSRAIAWATSSPWSHVGLLVRLDSVDRVMVLESVEKLGVRAIPLSSYVSRDQRNPHRANGEILIARHKKFEAQATPKRLRAMGEFAADRLGAPFSSHEVAKIGLRIALGGLGVRMPGRVQPKDDYICSEYVAGCYAALGIDIPWDGRGFIAPADFARDAGVAAVARLVF